MRREMEGADEGEGREPMSAGPTPPGEGRSLPPGAINGPGKREPLWVHGSLAIGPTKHRPIEMVTRDAEPKNADGCTKVIG
jgi:hypothetical protein